MSRSEIIIQPTGDAEFGPCNCCGQPTRRVWGFAHAGTATEAAYFVQWVPRGIPLHGAAFDLVMGRWGERTTPADRVAVSLAFRRGAAGPEFTVVDATGRYHAEPAVAAIALRRNAVLESSLAQQAFAIVDAIWLGDPRIAELLAPAG